MSNGCVALILAGGANSRADSYRGGKPKCSLPLGDGKPIIDHLIDALRRHDIWPVILGQYFHDEADTLADSGEGIIAALSGARKYLNHRRDTRILVCYGDTFLPWFPYIDACVPGTLTVAGVPKGAGNVWFGPEGAAYDAMGSGDFLEAGATCLSPEELGSISDFDTWPEFLNWTPWRRVCFHSGRVLNVGDAESYEEAKRWAP